MNRIITVQPRNVTTFLAVQWMGDMPDPDVQGLAEAHGWEATYRHAAGEPPTIRLTARGRAYKTLRLGQWLVALNSSGALRVLTDSEFHHAYLEAPEPP